MTGSLKICFFIFAVFLAAAFNTGSPVQAASQKTLTCDVSDHYPDFPNPDLLQKVARGFNLPNWDDQKPEDRPRLQTLKELNERGMTHIRLPVFHASFVESDLMGSEAQRHMKLLVQATRELIKLGYAVSIDLHPNGTFNQNYKTAPEATFVRLRAIWRALAEHIRLLPVQSVLVELLNEPNQQQDIWQDHSQKLVQDLRLLLPDHTIVMGPSGPQRHEVLQQMTPVEDPNVLYAVHFYDPFIFTHQGASWHPEDDPVRQFKQLPFPMAFDQPEVQALYRSLIRRDKIDAAAALKKALNLPWTFKDIDDAFAAMKRWSVKHKRFILINEFGTLSYDAPRSSRIAWLEGVVQRAEKNCFGWTHWDYSNGFGFINPNNYQPDEEILRALLKKVDNGKQ